MAERVRTSERVAGEIARLETLKDAWEAFESAPEVRKRRRRQAEILGEALLDMGGVGVPEEAHVYMVRMAPSDAQWLVSREQLEADGWRLEGGRLHLPPGE